MKKDETLCYLWLCKASLVQGQHLFPVKHKEQLSYKWNW